MKICPVCNKPMRPVKYHMVDPAKDIFQCAGDDSRREGDRVHRFARYDCKEEAR